MFGDERLSGDGRAVDSLVSEADDPFEVVESPACIDRASPMPRIRSDGGIAVCKCFTAFGNRLSPDENCLRL